MQKFRSFVLPIAILLGLLLHSWCSYASFTLPYTIFIILLMNYSAVDVRKLKPTMMDLWLISFQISVSIGTYVILHSLGVDEIICQGVLITILCPVAASVVVISCMLGANRERVTTYTILGNLMVAVVAPAVFSFMGAQSDMRFIDAFLMILRRIAVIIALPFAIALITQRWMKGFNDFVCRIKGSSFYIWAFTLFVTLGQTIDFIFLNGKENIHSVLILGAASVLVCALQFSVGKWIGEKYGDRMAGGQLLGQKNVAMGVWMANTFLLPLASVGIALYSIWQNLFNSWQLWRYNTNR